MDAHGNTYEIGGIDTGIVAYHSGRLLIPGEAAMEFPTVEEAKAYAEATVLLEHEHYGSAELYSI
jgi:hypothetical protein